MPHTVAGQDSHPGEGCGSLPASPARAIARVFHHLSRCGGAAGAACVVFTPQNLPVCDEPCWTQLKWPLIFIIPLAVIRSSPTIRSR